MRFYSTEWVAVFNQAVADLDTAPDVSLRMVQLVRGWPGPAGSATASLVLEVADGRISLQLDPADDRPADVTVALSYDDAAALSRGEVDPAQLLAAGRVKVRGDLSALVRGQGILADAALRVAALSPATTY